RHWLLFRLPPCDSETTPQAAGIGSEAAGGHERRLLRADPSFSLRDTFSASRQAFLADSWLERTEIRSACGERQALDVFPLGLRAVAFRRTRQFDRQGRGACPYPGVFQEPERRDDADGDGGARRAPRGRNHFSWISVSGISADYFGDCPALWDGVLASHSDRRGVEHPVHRHSFWPHARTATGRELGIGRAADCGWCHLYLCAGMDGHSFGQLSSA